MYEIVASPAFRVCLNRLIGFLERKYSREKALATRAQIKLAIEENLSTNPLMAPPSARLLELGIADYRQFVIGKHNLVFYRVDEKKQQIRLIAVMDARQNIQKLLSEVMLRF